MKRIFAGSAVLAALAVTACGEDAEPKAAAAVEASSSVATVVETDTPPAGAVESATPAAPNAPDFAVLYPDATPVGPATLARGPSGPGGIMTFTTPADPDAVVSFYRERAEAAGLATIASMNQGGTRAYSAGDGTSGGKLLRIIATPTEDGPTNVQLDWTAGR